LTDFVVDALNDWIVLKHALYSGELFCLPFVLIVN